MCVAGFSQSRASRVFSPETDTHSDGEANTLLSYNFKQSGFLVSINHHFQAIGKHFTPLATSSDTYTLG